MSDPSADRNAGITVIEIFSDAHYSVTAFLLGGGAERVAVTFTEFGYRRLDGHGFGTDFLNLSGFDVIAIKSLRDGWYHDLPDAAHVQIVAFLQQTGRAARARVGYGSSMGAYAAIRYGARLGFSEVVAISPQYDIAAPWDNRWAAQSHETGLIRLVSLEDVQPGCRYTILYDPWNKDVLHVDRYRAVVPARQLNLIEAPHSGHPAGLFMATAGLLKTLAVEALSGRPTAVTRRQIREGRARSGHYLSGLGIACDARNKPNWARQLFARSAELRPADAESRVRLAGVLHSMGQIQEALAASALAFALAPHHPNIASQLATLLKANGQTRQAMFIADLAVATHADQPWLVGFRDQLAIA